ncbi:UvrD-helicase domain-containing protein [Blattabacterium cuenoti]|uniref:UvrD-helicase domain-containing protein n=1 Tax=Blattabacterium cuenoti TaxID=1653831 RepID=UPI00163CFF15|nr:UvrD-helicase domain-containing protein [Blattabacterium cuenoti]
MLDSGTLKIYHASAGSGKTFILINSYLYILFKTPYNEGFKKILFLTFTRKSSDEMKKKIFDCIKDFSNKKIKKDYYKIYNFIIKTFDLTDEEFYDRSKKILDAIINDFSSFSKNISTIDKFTYRIVQSFKSNTNKRISLEMDTDHFLSEVVKNIMQKLQKSKKWAQLLVKFSLEKFKMGESWDIKKEIYKMAFLMIDENHYFFAKKIRNYSLNNFIKLKKVLVKRIIDFEISCENKGNKFFNFLKSTSINKSSFIYSDLSNFFYNIKIKNFIIDPVKKRLEKNIKNGILFSKTFYNKKQKNLIETHRKKIISLYEETKNFYKKNIFYYVLDKFLLKNINLLSIIHEIEKEFVFLKKSKGIILNSELNKILYEKINYSYPKIYEEIGMEYEYYFIDEFQDISYMQWKNIEILVENSLSENGSVIIVGDVKQSIYRWRGGDAKQFINLVNSHTKFYKKKIKTLDINYRSNKEIVKFNNSLYSYISNVFTSTIYKNVYKNTVQKTFKNSDGYVELNFFKKGFFETKNSYKECIYSKIKKKIEILLNKKYLLSDISILVRTNEECNFLSEKLIMDGFYVNTYGKILMKNHINIKIIINVLYVIYNPYSYEKRFYLILFLLKNKFINTKKNIHNFIENSIFLPLNIFFKKILFNDTITLKNYYNKSLYQIIEIIIESFKLLNSKNSGYIYSFLDFVYRITKQNIVNTISDFLYYWEQKKHKESVIYSYKKNSLHVMTIHKSKGLQFPIVILPFIDWKIISNRYREGRCIDIDPSLYNGLNTMYLDIPHYFSKINDKKINSIYNDYMINIMLDNINLLYVATTRSIEQLILFSKLDNKKLISHYIKGFLYKKKIWKEKKYKYVFGKNKKYY